MGNVKVREMVDINYDWYTHRGNLFLGKQEVSSLRYKRQKCGILGYLFLRLLLLKGRRS